MRTAKLDEIVRQRDASSKQVVEQLANGQVGEAIQGLERQGRCMRRRIKPSVSRPWPRSTPTSPKTCWSSHLTTVPAGINRAIRTELQGTGVVGREEHRTSILEPGRTSPVGTAPGPSYTTSMTYCSTCETPDRQDCRRASMHA